MNEHDFAGTSDQWEARVFRAATTFRVHRLYRNGHDSCEVDNFPDAIRTVGSVRHAMPGARTMIYAVTASGRSTLLPETRWAQYLGMIAV
jgi:hypothetical protein